VSDTSAALLSRLRRDSLWAGAAMAVIAAMLWPRRFERPLGVLGGLLLIAVSYRGIVAGVEAASAPPAGAGRAGGGRQSGGFRFVKFFTRHAILAVGAYVMMARFGFDPVAMLAGVSAPAVAAAAEIVRTVLARRGGSHTRST
jgi:hypothetical protein